MAKINTKTALITGITGQDGTYLAELLSTKGYKIFGLARDVSSKEAREVQALLPGIELVQGDLTDKFSLLRALDVSNPNEIYNLAAMSFVADSWEKSELTTNVTAFGALNLLESLRLFAGNDIDRIRYYQASSSEMFGAAISSPQDENTPFWPRSPYGVAKVFSHHMTVNFRESYGLHASSGILFNHESPRRGERFVTRKITKAVARIHLGVQKELVLGNLDTARDWGFAGDYVQAMWSMLQLDDPTDFVIATGKSNTLRTFVEVAFNAVGIYDWTKYVKQDPNFMRPADIQVLVGNPEKARELLGWKPKVSFEKLIKDMVEADIAKENQQFNF